MNDKTVTMDYQEHEQMIKNFKEMKEAKLCLLDIHIHSYGLSYQIGLGRDDKFVSYKYLIHAEGELKEKILSVLKKYEAEIIMPYIEKLTYSDMSIIELKAQIEFLKQELEKSKEQKSWKFWK